MTIQIPGYLQWVAYLTGSEWPQGDEDAMRRIADHWRSAAGDLTALVPDLNRVRSETLSVLWGETADAAEEQFAMLFDGEYSVDKLADAMTALGGLADSTGTQIEYTKLQILTSLVIAAAEITYALASSPPTFGASLAWIPVTEAITIMTVRQLVSMLLRQIVRELGEALTRTTVRRLIRAAGVEALQETAIGLGQELSIQGYQLAQGNRTGIDWNQVGTIGLASAVGGAVAAPVHHGASRLLGPADTTAAGIAKGAASGYTAGVVGNVAGTLATGGELDAVSIFGGAASSAATGGVHGAKGATGPDPSNGGPDTGSGPGPRPDSTTPDGPGDDTDTAGGDPGSNGQHSNNGADHPQNTSPTTTSTPESHPSSEPEGDASIAGPSDADSGAPAAAPTADAPAHTAPAAASPTSGDTSAPTSPSATTGDPGPSGPSDSSHAPIGQDGPDPRSDTPPGTTADPQQHTTGDPQQQTTDNGKPVDPRPAGDSGDPTGPASSRPESTTTPEQSDARQHNQPATENTTVQQHSPTYTGQPSAAAPSTGLSTGTPVTASPTAAPQSAATPGTTATPVQQGNPNTPPAAPPAPAARPTAEPSQPSHPSAGTPTKPVGEPVARAAENPAMQSISDSDTAGRHAQPDDGAQPTPDAAVPPIMGPLLPAVGGDTTPRANTAGRTDNPTPRARAPQDGSDRIGAARPTSDGDGTPPHRGRAEPTPNPDGPPVHHGDAGRIVDALESHRTAPDDGDTAGVHRAAEDVRNTWDGLSQAQRDVVIAQETREGHHSRLGDLDGLPAHVRDVLNRHNLVEDMARHHPEHADAIRAYANAMDAHLADPDAHPRPSVLNSQQLNPPQSRLARLASLFSTTSEDRRATRNGDAAWDGVYGYPENGVARQLYTYDPAAFNGDGRIAVVVGDLDTATAVAVHTPGITTTMQSTGLNVDNAENHFLRARREQPDLNTAVMSWIGYDAPSGNPIKLGRETATQDFASDGGNRLAHDVAGLVGSRVEAPDVNLFGHSYGSTTTAHAGVGSRLADYISTVTLLGSPGAGPLTHARDFGIGVENVYVASASRDVVTWAGSHLDGTTNRASAYLYNLSATTRDALFGGGYGHGALAGIASTVANATGRAAISFSSLGQGVDPAMAEFGATRLAAQYSSPEHLTGIKPHTRYFSSEVIGPDGEPVPLRSDPNAPVTESLDNFSHILTGNTGDLRVETGHRDPSAMFGDPARSRAVEPVPGYGANDCVPRTIDGFRERHPATTVNQVEGDHGDRGVPRSDYERALGTQLRDATLEDILAAVQRGESVVVVDTYHADGLPDGHPGSHTYAVEPNPDDPSRPLVFEGDERTPRPWPPQGLDHVARTQVATFHPDGTPTRPLTDDAPAARLGEDDRIAGDHSDPTALPDRDQARGSEYPPDHISSLLDLPAYRPGSLSDVEVRSVYLNGEQRMHALYESLVARGIDPEMRARAMFEARNELRSWARELMSDREGAQRLTRENPNHTWDEIVAKYRERGLTDDDLFNTIAERSMASRPSVNESLGLDPARPPPLPDIRDGPPRIGAAHPGNDTTSDNTTDPAVRDPDAPDPRDRPQHCEEHAVAFNEGDTPTTRDKRDEYERQIARQIDGLNDMTASELIHNMGNVERGGTAQTEAREKFRRAILKEELEDAETLYETDPDTLGGLDPEDFAVRRVDETMALLAALHEPDLVAGGLDVVPDGPDGRPSMGDRYVNSSIGSQWRHRVAALRAYAEDMVASGHGDERLNVRWTLAARR